MMGCVSYKASTTADRDFLDAWQLLGNLDEISSGGFREVRCRKSGRLEAMKCLDMRESKSYVAEEEARIWRKIGRHEHVVALIEACQLGGHKYVMIMERYECSLKDLIAHMPIANEPDIAYVITQMLSGIAHLHSKQIVHRDIKPANLLYGREDCKKLKLCNFEQATVIPPSGCLFGTYGTPSFMSPEMVGLGPHDLKTDVWSAGVVCYEILFRKFPYAPVCQNAEVIMQVIANGIPEPEYLGPVETTILAKEFVSTLLHRPMTTRVSAKQSLRLRFLQMASSQFESSLLVPRRWAPADNVSERPFDASSSLDGNTSNSDCAVDVCARAQTLDL